MATGRAVLAGASLLATALGSVHAFSVFLLPLEREFGASRAAVSLTYSLALVFLTLAVLFGHRVYGAANAAKLVLLSSGVAAAGALLAAVAESLPMVWLGYSVFFGAANGLGYGFGLQIAAQANPGREGVSMGIVTAAYAFGAVAAPPLFAIALDMGSFAAAMVFLALVLLAVGAASAWMMQGARYAVQSVPGGGGTRGVAGMWLGYFGGVMAGLMVIGHAAGIAFATDPGVAPWLAPLVIAVCNLVGSLAGGRAADALPARVVLVGLPMLSCAGLILLVLGGTPGLMVALGIAGFAYGGTIAAYPPVIAKRVGRDQSARVYGWVFTAWGVAGLSGPWLAGALYDTSGRYGAALLVAAGFALVSALAAAHVFRADETASV